MIQQRIALQRARVVEVVYLVLGALVLGALGLSSGADNPATVPSGA